MMAAGILFKSDGISGFLYRCITAVIAHLFLRLLLEKQAAGMFHRKAGSQYDEQKDDIDDFLKHDVKGTKVTAPVQNGEGGK